MKETKQKKIVKKSNVLIRSYWQVNSVWEPRLVALLASQIRIEDEEFKSYKIPVSELIGKTGQQRGGYIYDEISNAIENMMGRVIKIREDSLEKLYAVFSKCVIDRKRGEVELWFHSDLKKHYLQLKEKFTQYNLEEFLRLPSIYSQRLFEILSSWKNVIDGEITITMEELHRQLDTPKSQQKNFKEFRIYVLEKAYSDITKGQSVSLDFEWEAIKTGRKVTAVRFVFSPGKIERERKEKERGSQKRQSKRNNELYMAAYKCSKNMVTVPILEQDAVQRDQKQEVCNMCQSQEMVKSLFPLECRRYKRVEVLVD